MHFVVTLVQSKTTRFLVAATRQ